MFDATLLCDPYMALILVDWVRPRATTKPWSNDAPHCKPLISETNYDIHCHLLNMVPPGGKGVRGDWEGGWGGGRVGKGKRERKEGKEGYMRRGNKEKESGNRWGGIEGNGEMKERRK